MRVLRKLAALLRQVLTALLLLLGASDDETVAGSSDIRNNLRNAPGLVGLTLPPQYRNAVDELVELAPRQIPIPAASAAFTYRYNAERGEYERTSEGFGPTFLVERAQTLGQGVWSVGVTGQYLELDEFDGRSVGRDPDPVIVDGRAIKFSATPKIIYHVGTVNVTYGLLDDLDLNVAVPIATLDFDTNATRQSPAGGSPFIVTQHGHVPVGVSDILVRAKYRLGDWGGFTSAAGLIARLPSGDPDKALGTGDAEIGPYLALSTTLAGGWLEPHWNAGYDFNVNELHKSSAHYALGLDVQPCQWFNFGASLLGRSEVDGRRSAAAVSGPHQTASGPALRPYEGMNLDRKDFFDTQIGARFRLHRTLVLSLTAYRPINDDGLRTSNWSPLGALEATF